MIIFAKIVLARFFLKTNKMAIKRIFIVFLFFISLTANAQKAQRIGYIDMDYILENIPDYVEAQNQLDQKVKTWQKKLDAMTEEIETLKTDLSNEKSLLTKELIEEREEDIAIKNKELKRLQQAYFGPTGDLFRLRQQLATPVQDQVYNAIQDIAQNKRYDFVLDKSSDLILLYSNNKFDISELVLNSIVKNRKRQAVADKKQQRLDAAAAKKGNNVPIDENEEEVKPEGVVLENQDANDVEVVDEEISDAQRKINERNAKREALREKIKKQQEDRIRMRDSLKKVADEKRAAKLKEIEDRKKARESQIENNN